MFSLLKANDGNVLKNVNFSKNAIFYKDMLAFYCAFDDISTRKDLPNFCYLSNGELCLEGFCMLIKMYATEFKFETLKLTLDYLKILYYAIASYSVDGTTVDLKAIEDEFENYKNISINYCKEHKQEIEKYNEKCAEISRKNNIYYEKSKKAKRFSRVFNVLFFVFLFISLSSISLPILILTNGFSMLTMPVSICIVFGLLFISFFMKFLSKKIAIKQKEYEYQFQSLSRIDSSDNELLELRDKFNKILCEKYEYKVCFAETFLNYANVLEVDEIIKKANQYKILSYNLVRDLKMLFLSQQTEIDEIISQIENAGKNQNFEKDFEEIYSKILYQDWLYYNAEIRMHFIKKFCDLGEKNFVWKLRFNGLKINPFDIQVRELTREKIAFFKRADKRVITSNLADFMNTKFIKSLDEFEFHGNYSPESIKSVKSSFLQHFCSYNVIESFGENLNQEILEDLIDEFEKIPTYVNMRIKLIENIAGLGNSDSKVIKLMAEALFGKDIEESEDLEFNEKDIEHPKFEASELRRNDDELIYIVNGKEVVGYKVD